MTTNEFIHLSTKNRIILAKNLCHLINKYLKTKPCSCEEDALRVWHQFGAMIVCTYCGKCGRFIKGNDYQAEEEHEHCVSVYINFNSQGYEINRSLRSPGSLKRDGIAMRNLKGEFIR